MEKFVRGPFSTIDEVKKALDRLHREGYSSKDVTVVANSKEDLEALSGSTSTEVAREDKDSFDHTENLSYLGQVTDRFSGFFFHGNITGTADSAIIGYAPTPKNMPIIQNMPEEEHDIEDEDPREILANFKEDLEDGKIVILVEDTLNIDAKFNLDAIGDLKDSKDTNTVDKEIIDADPSQVMDKTITERDSHPDIENDEEVLEQETTYIPTDSNTVVDKKDNHDHPTL